ncbi:hypothetical protein MBLNU459_g7953t1 [Dothideomycetes sp. NU459]
MRIDQIINSPVDVAGRKHDTYSSSKAPSLGLLTKTLAGSPTIRWILPARIRHAQKDDLIFVGEDFIHLKEISEQGHLHHVATKADFGCCIMSAKILGNIDEDTLQTHIKTEDEEMSDGFCSEAKLPPQVLVLALESQQLVFVFASKDSSGNIQFDMASSIPLPVFTMPYQQLGKHLAVDPKSRAMAIAAPRNNIYLYSVRPMQRLHQGGAALGNKVLPVSTEGSLINVEGTILHMDFLFPPNDDTDHIVLLLIVMMNNRVALRRIDWLYASNLRATTLHDPQRLPKGYPLPTLLVPIESNNASFLLLSKASASIDIYENILAGYATQKHIAVPWQPPKNPGTSSKMPVWTAWARARRTSGPAQTRDCLYLASEDGWVYYITLNKQSPAQGVNANTVNHLGCDISSAFTCYGNVSQSDIFAVVGDLSQGGAHEVLMPSYDDQGSRLIEIFDNWTPTADVVASRLSLAHNNTQPLTIRSHRYTTVGLTTVRLRRDYSSTGCNAFATSGHDLLSIKWKGAGSEEPNVSKVWLTNATDPSFRQKSIAAFACVPDLDTYPVEFSCALVVISDGYGLITHVEDDIKVIPRSSPLQGSPDRTIYAPRIGCFVTASSKMTLRQFSPTRTTRCLQSVIEFTPTKRSSNAYTYEMAPGVQILSMMEWSYKTAGKEYAFVAVGSGAVGPADNESPIRGELTLLQPIVRNGIVCDVRTQKTIARYERNQSVTAIVAYGTLELAACVDKWLYLYRFLPEQTKFEEVCKYQFNSRGVSITAAPPLLHVTTAADSIITLELIESTVGGTRVTARADTLERYFRPIGMDTRSRKGLHHMTITTRQPAETSLERADAQSLTLNIMSTRNCEVVGFISPSINSRTHKKAMTTQFSAKLSRSQVRLREAHIRPPWKPDHAPGILEDRLIGFAVDGTITGLAILEPATAHRLRWVQRLCERSSIVCPWLPRHMNNDFQGEEDSDPYLMLPPLGFGYEATQTPRLGPEALAAQMHVDGDILQRLLLRGGVDLLKQMLEEEATRKDRLADWMRANLEKQMTMVEMMIAEVKSTIDRWI